MIEAKVIADSIVSTGDEDRYPLWDPPRLTTLEVEMNRFVLAEFNTHRLFSRSSASSRAIPFKSKNPKTKTTLKRVQEDTAYPVIWAAEQPGMQGGDEIENPERAKVVWDMARDDAVRSAEALYELGVHKSLVNRLLEPFMWHRVIVTSTCWENFFRQRCSPLAQPEIRLAAEAMQEAIEKSTPKRLTVGQWHMPYIDEETIRWSLAPSTPVSEEVDHLELQKRVSVARCARVSYLTHDGKRDPQVDLDLYDKLVTADPPHWAPLEHVATPTPEGVWSGGNFRGWTQLRQDVEVARGINTKV